MSNTIQPLNVSHLMIAADIIDSVMSAVPRDELEQMLSGQGSAKDLGFKLISVGIKHAKTGVMEIMASVNGMTIDEFKKEPISVVTKTIKAIQEDERNADFFTQLGAFFGEQKDRAES